MELKAAHVWPLSTDGPTVTRSPLEYAYPNNRISQSVTAAPPSGIQPDLQGTKIEAPCVLVEAVAVLKMFPLPLLPAGSMPSFPTLFGVVHDPLMGIAVAERACV